MKNVKDERKNREFYVRMGYYRKAFGQKCTDYLCPKTQ